MNEIFDKLILFLCCTTLYLFDANNSFVIVPVITCIILSSLFIYFDNNQIKLLGIIFFFLLCFFMPNYIIFVPLLLYDIFHTKYQIIALTVPFFLLYQIPEYKLQTISFIFIFLGVSCFIKFKTDYFIKLKNEYNELRDNSTKLSLQLKEKNQSLLKNQDYEINLATLNERNRISKELHDSIGHLLSRSLLQVGALLTVVKEEPVREGLTDLKLALSGGMDQIRSSIHNMYDESIDLYAQFEHLVKGFTFCPVIYEYDITNPPSLQLKHCLIAIAKEALSNIIRHSNATKVIIILREHPAMYQLIIQDNGTIEDLHREHLTKTLTYQEYDDGMGLKNIYDRVKSFEGNINITLEQGFKIFITVPKKAE